MNCVSCAGKLPARDASPPRRLRVGATPRVPTRRVAPRAVRSARPSQLLGWAIVLLVVALMTYGVRTGGAALSATEVTSAPPAVTAPTVSPAALVQRRRTPGAAAWIATGRDPSAQRATITSSGANGFAAGPNQP
ncbi:MAG: hypothetical protein JO023_20655 [Chloroflexi bacterium]|nr:hypothetical protein [Chloroflexota bacterium]